MRPVIICSCVMLSLSVVLGWELLTPADDDPTVKALANPGQLPLSPPAASSASAQRFDADALSKIAVSVTERPLFMRTRRPSATASKAGSATPQDELPRLAAVVVGPEGGRAVFVGTDGKSHVVIAGDVIGAFEIREIVPGVVTLKGSGGDRVLRPTYVVTHAAAVPATLPTSEISSWLHIPSTPDQATGR